MKVINLGNNEHLYFQILGVLAILFIIRVVFTFYKRSKQ